MGERQLRKSLPFALTKDGSFFESLGDWMGDVLYDELPEKGFECRDEQIFMAYQIGRLKEKNVLFAEAGVGTEKPLPIYCRLYPMHAIQVNQR
ncbi:hypothetical protein LSPH24S_03427 [Lysinibacillus sphaericus]